MSPCRRLVAAFMICFPGLACAALGEAGPEVAVQARLRFEAPQITGSAEIHWRNAGPKPARTLRLLLFANRFRSITTMNNLARHLLVADAELRAGGTEIRSAEEAGRPLAWKIEAGGTLSQMVAAIDLGRDVAPGGEVRVTIDFETTLPNVLDTFVATDDLVIANGGWAPLPISFGAATDERPDCPAHAQLRARLSPPAGSSLLVDGRLFEMAESVEMAGDERLALVLSRGPFESVSFRVGKRSVRIYSPPPLDSTFRWSDNQSAVELMRETLPSIVSAVAGEGEVAVVRLPLRWYPSAAAPGMVLVSDRLFEVFPVLRPLHQRELAYAVLLEEELESARRREPAEDAGWVAEGLAWRRAEALYAKRFREGKEVKDWIRLLGVFAIVDRFETAPRVPFVRAFFPVATSDDPLRIRLEGVCDDRPPGRFLFDKLAARLRPEGFAKLLERYRTSARPMREVLAKIGGSKAEELLRAWLRPAAAVDYALDRVELNPGGAPGARFEIRRDSEEQRLDSVEIELEKEDGKIERAFVDLDGAATPVERPSATPVASLLLDPDRRTVDRRLDNNRVPGGYQLVLDSADVEVSSTEFGISGLLVGRRRYDYRKDLAAAAFYTSRGTGIDAGVQLHGGEAIDANLYRQNLFAYYAFQQLDSTFTNQQRPALRTRGQLGGFGLRFNSYDAFWFVNPAGSYHLRMFFDGYDRALGSDYDFVRGGGSLAYTLPIRGDTVLAAEVLNGYTAATGSGAVPNQGLFSLGGFRSIRGIGAEDDLGKDIFLLRAELRHLLPFRLDWNFEDLLIARRLQLKVFVDAGRVENDSRRLYDASGFAVGVGGGLNLFYDFMGFFPTTFYLDVATRADRGSKAQVLFGVGQPF